MPFVAIIFKLHLIPYCSNYANTCGKIEVGEHAKRRGEVVFQMGLPKGANICVFSV